MHVNVWLVDDAQGFVEAVEKRLTRRGMTVRTALSGEAAMAALQAAGAEVVVLDVKMPGMDGIKTLRRIKAEFPQVEVIMLTGHGTVETANEGLRLGAFDYLMKPCEIEDLVVKVGKAAQRHQGHAARVLRAGAEGATARQDG